MAATLTQLMPGFAVGYRRGSSADAAGIVDDLRGASITPPCFRTPDPATLKGLDNVRSFLGSQMPRLLWGWRQGEG